MDINDINAGAEIAKNSSEALKNFQAVIESVLGPRGIDAAIIDGHKKIIEQSNFGWKKNCLERFTFCIKKAAEICAIHISAAFIWYCVIPIL